MTPAVKFYKIKLIKNLLEYSQRVRNQLLDELVTNATDPVVYSRRLRMLRHVNLYENQLIQKIQNFDTDDVDDFAQVNLKRELNRITHRSA